MTEESTMSLKIFWDIANIAISERHSATDVYGRILDHCVREGIVTKKADVESCSVYFVPTVQQRFALKQHHLEQLDKLDCTVIACSSGKEDADRKMARDMLKVAPPYKALLISSDQDFSQTVKKMEQAGVKTYVLHEARPQSNHELNLSMYCTGAFSMDTVLGQKGGKGASYKGSGPTHSKGNSGHGYDGSKGGKGGKGAVHSMPPTAAQRQPADPPGKGKAQEKPPTRRSNRTSLYLSARDQVTVSTRAGKNLDLTPGQPLECSDDQVSFVYRCNVLHTLEDVASKCDQADYDAALQLAFVGEKVLMGTSDPTQVVTQFNAAMTQAILSNGTQHLTSALCALPARRIAVQVTPLSMAGVVAPLIRSFCGEQSILAIPTPESNNEFVMDTFAAPFCEAQLLSLIDVLAMQAEREPTRFLVLDKCVTELETRELLEQLEITSYTSIKSTNGDVYVRAFPPTAKHYPKTLKTNAGKEVPIRFSTTKGLEVKITTTSHGRTRYTDDTKTLSHTPLGPHEKSTEAITTFCHTSKREFRRTLGVCPRYRAAEIRSGEPCKGLCPRVHFMSDDDVTQEELYEALGHASDSMSAANPLPQKWTELLDSAQVSALGCLNSTEDLMLPCQVRVHQANETNKGLARFIAQRAKLSADLFWGLIRLQEVRVFENSAIIARQTLEC